MTSFSNNTSALPNLLCCTTTADADDATTAITNSGLQSESSTSSLQTHPSIPSLQLNLQFSMSSDSQPPSVTHFLPHPISALALSPPYLYAASGSQLHIFQFSPSSSSSTKPSPSPSPSLSLIQSFPSLSSSRSNPAPIKSICFSHHPNRNHRRSTSSVLTAHQDGKIRVWLKQSHNKDDDDEECCSSSSSSSSSEQLTHRLLTILPTAIDKLRRFSHPKNYIQIRRHKKRLWIYHNDAVSSLTTTTTTTTSTTPTTTPNNDVVYSVSWDKSLKVWRTSDYKCLESITAHEDAVNAVTVSLHDGVVYTGSADGRIRVWVRKPVFNEENEKRNQQRHVLVATLEKHKSSVNALAIMINSANGSMLLFSGACDRSILVWVRDNKTVDDHKTVNYNMIVTGALRGHVKAVLCLVTVRDEILLSGSADWTVRIWRRGVEGKFTCVRVLDGYRSPVKSVQAVFAPVSESESDSEVINVFSGGLDGEIRYWRVKLPPL